MIDLKQLRQNPQTVREALSRRGMGQLVDGVLALDQRRRELLVQVEQYRGQRNQVSERVASIKREHGDAGDLIEAMRTLNAELASLEEQLKDVDAQVLEASLVIPNPPHEDVVPGGEEHNQILSLWGTPRQFSFTPLPHWEIGQNLGILDFDRGGKVSGTRFLFYRGQGAALERALMNFMLAVHVKEHGYTEMLPPYLVSAESCLGTGNLPKFAEEMFQTTDGRFLIPTAEVPLTNYHRDEILSGDALPIKYVAYSPCFRSEAGSAGRDTRGLIRMHQFQKVEMVKFVHPDASYLELESLVDDARAILELLALPYRKVALAAGDLSFSSAKTYDLEVWLPAANTYREISSCSNFEAFQARRAGIRFRPAGGGKVDYVHTLNGSGLAIGRTVAAILENYQMADGRVRVPEVLRPYLGGQELIEPERVPL